MGKRRDTNISTILFIKKKKAGYEVLAIGKRRGINFATILFMKKKISWI